MFGIYSALITRLDPGAGTCRQLFVLTHNTAFLRHWAKDLKGRETPATLHLMKSMGEGPERSPVLTPIDPNDSRESVILETEYILLFHSVAFNILDALDDPSAQADLRMVTSAPNDARKLLEHFLQFRVPRQGTNLTNAIELVLASKPELAREVTRFVHGNSHRSPDMNGRPLLDLSVRRALTGVFTLIRDTDPTHFEGMCHRLGITDRMHRLVSM
jgi:wobble nucleotide-excising tRNase